MSGRVFGAAASKIKADRVVFDISSHVHIAIGDGSDAEVI